MPFQTDLELRHRPGHDRWELAAPLGFLTWEGRQIVVPSRFRTDLASVPRLVWRIVPRDHAQARRPAVVHDYIYTHLTAQFSKSAADEIFYQALLEEGMGKALAWLMWCAVRLGGRGNWRTA
jgi:hypothetical protein